jgi:uncharacterized lipoprotein YmbA
MKKVKRLLIILLLIVAGCAVLSHSPYQLARVQNVVQDEPHLFITEVRCNDSKNYVIYEQDRPGAYIWVKLDNGKIVNTYRPILELEDFIGIGN